MHCCVRAAADVSRTRDIGGVAVTAPCAAALNPSADDLLEMLARLGAQAGPPPGGARMRWVWSAVTLVDRGDGGRLLHEPDFAGDALHATRPSLDATFATVRDQAAFCRAAGAAAADCWFDGLVLVGPDALAAAEGRLVRSAPVDASDTGWYLAAADEAAAPDDPNRIATVRAYELMARRPHLVEALAMPVGSVVLFTADRLRVVHG